MTERSIDAVLQFVADRRRRQVIRHLRHQPRQTTVDDLVDRLLNIDSHTDDPTTDRTQLTIHLYHAQLPKLADHGVVEFDPENRTVHYQGDEQLESVLDALPNKPSVART